MGANPDATKNRSSVPSGLIPNDNSSVASGFMPDEDSLPSGLACPVESGSLTSSAAEIMQSGQTPNRSAYSESPLPAAPVYRQVETGFSSP